jgi:excisionase family DNA binding protein
MVNDLPEILTISETAEYLRISLSSLYKLAQEGKIPCQKVGRHWRFRRESIDRWLESTQRFETSNRTPIHNAPQVTEQK